MFFNKKIKSDLATVEARNRELQSLNRDLLDQIDTLTDKKKRYKKEIVHLHIEINRLKKVIGSQQESITSLTNELDVTNRVREENRILFTNSLKENERYRETINTLEERNTQLAELLVTKDKEYNNILNTIKSAIEIQP